MSESETSTGANVAEAGQGIAGSNSELLPLDLAERVVVLRMRESGAIRRHIFRRIERADVDAYFAASQVSTLRTGQTTENEIDIGSAELALFARAIVRVEGYKLSDGRDLMELPQWRNRVPGGHRISSIDVLMKVMKSSGAGEQLIDAEYDVVSLDACWTEKEGSMSFFRNLLHRFAPPTGEHWKRFNGFKTRTVAIKGSRAQKTIYPRLDGVLGDIYDSLIQGVDGYSFHGAPLTDRTIIISNMDHFHKISAIAALFDKSEFDSSDDEEVG